MGAGRTMRRRVGGVKRGLLSCLLVPLTLHSYFADILYQAKE